MGRIAIFLMLVGAARGEFLQIEVFMRDMNCPSCTDSMAAAFKRLRGVEKVEIDQDHGSVRLELAKPNRISVEQVWDTVKRIGFTPGETRVAVHGNVKKDGARTSIEVTELGRTYEIEGAGVGDDVSLKGVITPPPDPRTAIRIRVQ